MLEAKAMAPTLLRKMRQRMEDRFDWVDQKPAAHDARFEVLQKTIDDVNKAAFGEAAIWRLQLRNGLTAIEARLAALEGRS